MPTAAKPTARPSAQTRPPLSPLWRALAAAGLLGSLWLGHMATAHSQTTAAQRNSGRVALAIPGQAQAQNLYEGSYALLIGASAYRNGWKPLPGVKNDIPAVKAALEKHGFKVQVVNDPTRDQLDAALRNFVAEHGQKEGNRLLVYFAGHGESLDARTGSKLGYIVPVDAPLPQADMAGFKRVAYSMDAIEGHARQMDAKHALFVFDSCFSGTIFAKRANTPDSITDKTSRPVRQFITSGDAGQTVPDESLFRKRFVRALLDGDADLNRDTYITGSELGSYLEDSVTNDSRRTQTPRHGKIMREDLDQGDFVFASLRAESSGQPPTRPPLPGPAQGSGLSLEDLEREEATRKEWAQWQARMKADFDRTAAFKGSADLQAKAWERFLAAWGQDNPLSGEDEGLRAQAQGRMQERQQEAQRLAAAAQATVPVTPAPTAPTVTAQPAQPGQAFRDCAQAHCPELVVIPAGSFTMGSNDGEPDEKPPHRVNIRSFALGKYEVTQGQWKAVMGSNPSGFSNCGDNCPVERVSWDDIQQYLAKLNAMTGMKYRLASEAEWEYAARAGTTGKYWWGETASHEYANYGKDECPPCGGLAQGRDKWEFTAPVGQFPANGFGLHDMHGNVWEWVEDVLHDNYSGAPTDGSAWQTGGDASRRVLRGGSWDYRPGILRSANRYWNTPDVRVNDFGFRLARTVP